MQTAKKSRPGGGTAYHQMHLHSSPVAELLARLEKVKQTGPERWIACCPAHGDKSPSLAIREAEDGRALLHCFGGCSVESVVRAVGLELADLFPKQIAHHAAPERRPFNPADVLACIALEALIVLLCAETMQKGQALSAEDHARLATAWHRIDAAAKLARGAA